MKELVWTIKSLGFAGSEVIKHRGNLLILTKNLSTIPSLRTYSSLCYAPRTKMILGSIMHALDEFTDVSQWHFVLPTQSKLTNIMVN
jgi:hypothetical protein